MQRSKGCPADAACNKARGVQQKLHATKQGVSSRSPLLQSKGCLVEPPCVRNVPGEAACNEARGVQQMLLATKQGVYSRS